jgi:hypothetical protein
VRFLTSGSCTTAPAILALPFLWTLFVIVLLVVGANNLENLMADRPLHWHPQ